MRIDIGLPRTGAVVLAVTMGFAVTAWAEGVKVPNPVPYARHAEVREKVRTECRVGEKLASFLEQFGDDIEFVTGVARASGRVLQIEMTDVFAPGGVRGLNWARGLHEPHPRQQPQPARIGASGRTGRRPAAERVSQAAAGSGTSATAAKATA
jgi:hypothetical protein